MAEIWGCTFYTNSAQIGEKTHALYLTTPWIIHQGITYIALTLSTCMFKWARVQTTCKKCQMISGNSHDRRASASVLTNNPWKKREESKSEQHGGYRERIVYTDLSI